MDATDILQESLGTDDGQNHIVKLIQEGEYEMALSIMGMIASAMSTLKISTAEDKVAIQKLKKELLTNTKNVTCFNTKYCLKEY